MRLGGFEPPTDGLEGRCSSAELQAPGPTGYSGSQRVRASGCGRRRGPGGLRESGRGAGGAEGGGADRARAAAVDAGGARRVHGAEADLAPAAREQVRAMHGAAEPEAKGANGADVRPAPDEVLADRPAAEAARPVEPRDALRERGAVGGVVAEEAHASHLAGVTVGGRCKRG